MKTFNLHIHTIPKRSKSAMLLTLLASSILSPAAPLRSTGVTEIAPMVVECQMPSRQTEDIYDGYRIVYIDTCSNIVRFEQGSSQISKGKEIDNIVALISGIANDENNKGIKVWAVGYASPEGTEEDNRRLSLRRGKALATYLYAVTALPAGSDILIENVVEDWDGLVVFLKNSTIPNKDAVLRIINSESNSWNRKVAICKLDNGKTWERLKKEIFPSLRKTLIKVSYWTKDEEEKPVVPCEFDFSDVYMKKCVLENRLISLTERQYTLELENGELYRLKDRSNKKDIILLNDHISHNEAQIKLFGDEIEQIRGNIAEVTTMLEEIISQRKFWESREVSLIQQLSFLAAENQNFSNLILENGGGEVTYNQHIKSNLSKMETLRAELDKLSIAIANSRELANTDEVDRLRKGDLSDIENNDAKKKYIEARINGLTGQLTTLRAENDRLLEMMNSTVESVRASISTQIYDNQKLINEYTDEIARLNETLSEIRSSTLAITKKYSSRERKMLAAQAESTYRPTQPTISTPQTPSRVINKEQIRAVAAQTDHILSMRTNVLLDALLVPNIGVEYNLGSRWSLGLEAAHSGWDLYGQTDTKLRRTTVRPEARYWFASHPTKGWYLGLHLMGGTFNYALGGDWRYQDKHNTLFYGGGVDAGYRVSLSRHWGMDFGLGFGTYNLTYNKYYNVENGALYSTGTRIYTGIDNLQIGLLYKFNVR